MKTPIIFMILLFCLSSIVYGVGISASDLDIETYFVPNTEFRFDYMGTTNKDFDDIDYTAFPKGDIAEYVVFDKSSFENVPKNTQVPLGGYIKFPSSLTPPGHNLQICFLESCPEEAPICGRAGVCASIYVKVPYDGKFPSVSLNVPNVNEKEKIRAIATVQNVGVENISMCTGSVDFFDARTEIVGNAKFSDAGPVASFGSVTLEAVLDDPNIKPGDYSASAMIDCDGNISKVNAVFRVGTLDVKIIDHTRDLETGGIKRFVTVVESSWNDPLDTYAVVRIYDSNTSVSAKSATVILEAWKKISQEAFIDTTNLQEKVYDVSIDAYYAGKSTHLDSKVNLIKAPEGAEVVVKEAPSSNMTFLTIILIIIVLLLTAINIFLAFYRKKKEDEDGK